MRIPTESEIDAVVSELQISTATAHEGSVDKDHDCDFCQFSQEMYKRTKSLEGKEDLCLVDKIARSCIDFDNMLLASLFHSPFAPTLIEMVMRMGRSCFFIGMLVGRNQVIDERMKDMEL